MRLGVGDQGERLDLASGSRRGGHGDHGAQRPFGLALPPVVAHLAAVRQQEVRALGRVEAAAAADGDEQVGAVRARGREAASFADIDAIVDWVVQGRRSGDVVLVMSNGGFEGIHRRILDALPGEEA